MRLALPGLFLLALPCLAHGAPAADPCANAATQAQMNACAGQAYRESDAALNAAYHEAMTRLAGNPDAVRRLVAAQRAWLAFRDAECAFVASGVEGGSAQPMTAALCLERQTRARTEALRGYLACEEGDLSCPVPRRP